MTPEEYIDKKEWVAAQIFDFDGDEYVPPHEEHCHELAENILNGLGFYPVVRGICPYCKLDPMNSTARHAIRYLCNTYKCHTEMMNPGGRELGFPEPIGRIQLTDMCYHCDYETIIKRIKEHEPSILSNNDGTKIL